jgi:hypothetical protein
MDHRRYRRRLAQSDCVIRLIVNLQSQIVSIITDGCTCSKSAARSPVQVEGTVGRTETAGSAVPARYEAQSSGSS